ncbi:related to LIM homeobox protein [Cephalotrichum gorgonifer]|uniref:Related to LIM homeobox protein n=1 Tax=Cephalotrichum gorgonifer TaxID=2041049 RepID=A0AAE8MRP3_9PEZI|nr:related to LIM homeobox protein [Cephalotrichum gorgonifer]
MASTGSSPSSSLESPGHVVAYEPGHITPPDTTSPYGELTVVNVDPQKHPKNKRKRTQAGDKSVLEAAYRDNPKPDKIARLEIVKRVSLNEKEVQIWFQNRRQNDRRKSRPLTPQEVAALRCGGMQIVPDPSLPTSSMLAETPYSPSPAPAPAPAGDATTNPSPPMSSHDSGSPQPREQACSDANESPRNGDSEKEIKEGVVEPEQTARLGSTAHSPGLSQSFPGASGGYLANRWNASTLSTPSAARDEYQKAEFFTPPSCASSRSDMNGNSSRSSRVRLSFSFDGKAEIVSNDASPPRVQPERPMSTAPTLPQVRPRGLQRSHSALPSVTLPPISTLTGGLPPPPRLLRGRSRDVNAWELCCDDEAPDDLTKMAENEANGSALAAISLLRSTSCVLQPSSNKRNAPLSRNPQRNPLAKKPKLGRSHSSISRHGVPDPEKTADNDDVSKEKDFPTKKLRVSMLVSPSGDSDKENLSPDEDGNPQLLATHRRALPQTQSRRAGKALEEQSGAPALGNSRGGTSSVLQRVKRAGSPLKIFEDGGEDEGERVRLPEVETESFMKRGVSPGKMGDADCVAGLLALSQGAWQ